MDNDAAWDDEIGRFEDARSDVAAFNTTYGVFHHDGRLTVFNAGSPEETPASLDVRSFTVKPVLALSNNSPYLLAVSDRSNVLVYDLRSLALLYTLQGIGRRVTALAWSQQQPKILAVGCIDGSVRLLDLRGPTRPVARLTGYRGVCHSVAFHADDGNMRY